MNYWTGATALVGLCTATILLMASLSWFVKRRRDRLPMAYLLALASLAALQSLEFLYHATGWFRSVPFFLKLVDPLIVLIPFCIYGYIRALQGEDVLADARSRWLHALPAALVALLAVPFWSLPGEKKIHWMLQGMSDESLWQPLTLFGNPYLALIGGLSLLYWWLQQRRGIHSRKAAVRDWIGHLQRLQLIIAASMAVRILLYTIYGESFSVAFVLAPVTAYLTFLLLSHARPPTHIAAATNAPVSGAVAASLTPAADKDAQQQQQLFGQLCAEMEQGAYKDASLTLGKLAERCDTTTHQASAAINLCSGSNFYEWVNQYRIAAACDALCNTDLSVTQICYEAGFNSKSSFNTAFRKINGCTPTQYRKQKLQPQS
ncbi:AraC family transcriptional regulator [Granulosicoccaceae sp. 1_MG-2023]|nr:AraC family transcriptional regulator [Granulosicoccaceae sp. 1_MG-2023]